MQGQVRAQLQRLSAALAAAGRTLHAVSPLATLDRGYAIVMTEAGRVVMDAGTLAAGDRITARVAHGHAVAVVESVTTSKDKT